MPRELFQAALVVLCGATGTYLLLPQRHAFLAEKTARIVGSAFAGLALLLFALLLSPPGPFISGVFFYAFAIASVTGAFLSITSSDPVHSALWFASVILATSGLFLLAGAQFLAVGTIIVYAGAIIVTFLFVIMLAQMEGRALYDRAARLPFRASWTCFLLFFAVLWSLLHVPAPGGASPSRLLRTGQMVEQAAPKSKAAVRDLLDRAERPTARMSDAEGRAKPHVTGLGETLFTDHLITVELAGSLLFVALIAAVAIATPKAPIRPVVRQAGVGPTVA